MPSIRKGGSRPPASLPDDAGKGGVKNAARPPFSQIALSAARNGGSDVTYIAKVLLGGELDEKVLEDAERSTLMLVDDPLRQYSSFFLRLLAATVVATAGIAADSATTIIGAMLIAPLMSPMLGTALATALGRPAAAVRTLALVLFGMALVVAVSAGVTALIPVAADMETNTQVLARISPRLVDLVIALAAGFVAALASMRRDIPDTLPGVAISASIVPPLCVVGAGLYEGAPQAALGALLLFCANFVAIQVMGSAVYLLMGLGAKQFSTVGAQARLAWYCAVAAAVVAIGALFMNTSMGVLRAAEEERVVQDTATAWLEGTDYRVVSLSLDENNLYLQIAGNGTRPLVRRLNDRLIDAGVELQTVSLSVVDEQRIHNG